MKTFKVVFTVDGVLAETEAEAVQFAYATVDDNEDGDGYETTVTEVKPEDSGVGPKIG